MPCRPKNNTLRDPGGKAAPTTEGATSGLRAYVLRATACNQASCPGTQGPAYVERQLQATVAK